MSQPKQAKKYQLAGFLVILLGLLILIAGAVAKSTVLSSIGFAALVTGGASYVLGRSGLIKDPEEPGQDQ